MAWTAPMTAVDNDYFSADQYNLNIRDNLLQTAPAKATTASGFFATNGANSLVERIATTATVLTSQTTTSSTFVDLPTVGPSVTVTTGTLVLVSIGCDMGSGTLGGFSRASFAISGATTAASANLYGITTNGLSQASANCRYGATYLRSVTAGSNTFTMQYRSDGSTSTFSRREITVIPL